MNEYVPGTLFIMIVDDSMSAERWLGMRTMYRLYVGEIDGHHRFLEVIDWSNGGGEPDYHDDLPEPVAWLYNIINWTVHEPGHDEMTLYDYKSYVMKRCKE